MAKGKQIEVWCDETSDAGESRWCVSLCDSDGQEVRCLSAHDDHSAALEAGREDARARGYRLCERGEQGSLEEIASVESIQMEAALLGYGDRFVGNRLQDTAADWIDHGFTVEDASGWWGIGVWNAAVGAELCGAGLSPQEAEAAAEEMVEGLDDPASKYTDGDPIYAACNGDIAPSVIISWVSDRN